MRQDRHVARSAPHRTRSRLGETPWKLLAAATLIAFLSGCGGAAPTPIVIYVTPAPTSALSAAPSPRPTIPPPTRAPTASPTPLAWRLVPATNGKASGLRVEGKAALSWGRFSEIEGETARLVVKVTNKGSALREIEQGFPENDLSTESRVVIHFSDGRTAQMEPADTTSHRLAADNSTWLLSGWAWTYDDFAAAESVEVIVLTRAPRGGAEVWMAQVDKLTSSGDSVTVSGTVRNLFSDGRFPPLITAVILDDAAEPLTYSVAALRAKNVESEQDAPWTVAEELPSGLADLAHSVEVFAASSLDVWGPAGDLTRNLRDIMDAT